MFFFQHMFNICTAQPYESLFGNSSTAWNELCSNLFGQVTDSLIAGNDTIINSETYKIIKPASCLYNGGFLREDPSTGKAWFVAKNGDDTVEKLIMDLSLGIGDSFLVYRNSLYYGVDSVYIYGGRKHVRLVNLNSSTEKFTFIEGIGTTRGLTYQMTPSPNMSALLLCSFKDEIQIYQNNEPGYSSTCSVLNLGINDGAEKKYDINIYPNPSSGIFNISINSSRFDEAEIEVLDVTGKPVQKIILGNSAFNLTNYPKGLYFVKVKIGNSVVVEKVIYQ
jgi:hypothetical protein